MRKLSLRGRLTLLYGGLFMVAGVLLLGVIYVLFTNNLSQQYRVVIQGTYVTAPTGTPSVGRPPRLPNQAYVINKDGDVLTGLDAERVLQQQREQVRQAAVKSLLTQGSIALLAVGALAAGFGWLVSGRVLAPLHQVTDTARRIAASPSALHERIALRGPDDEVKNLADAFDTMVERLDHSFDGQRRFVANASHELRTPLTLGRALVEVAMHRRTASADVKELGESLLTINARHEQLIEGLLILADSEKQLTTVYPVNLADVVTHVTAQLTSEATTAGVEVIRGAGDAPTRGDALLLERLVHNLVENGIRHNVDADRQAITIDRSGSAQAGDAGETADVMGLASGRWVQVLSRTADDRVELVVTNTGPEVPPYEVDSLFKPFYRLGAERLVGGKGAGLGLSIVRSVTEAHGGTVTAVPREGGGLQVTVSLPRDPS
ncbi:signal transduction histidine kinase [Kribbella sp. VKM Ac-2571]|uniref:sensor histidine kinase n=1 Tax=Kribbella sp. VKM Ac-2571 TaxID=2512222 RepID=UPI0010D17446|nr:HAMP domain-containing sensor histidine kinase [Kribbella sp. VKM Ac-2571]TDO49614.1 signal transduction histidine kinase [Kribbella sp. VKM Ac-2571]